MLLCHPIWTFWSFQSVWILDYDLLIYNPLVVLWSGDLVLGRRYSVVSECASELLESVLRVCTLYRAPTSVCVPCPWSSFWLTGVTKGRPQHRAMSKVQLRNKSWPRCAHTQYARRVASQGLCAPQARTSHCTELSIIRESQRKARIFSNNYFQSTLLLFQLPASARGIGDSGVSTVQRAIVREILQRSAVDVRPADLRGLLCDLVCRVQFAHIKHTWARTNMMCTLRCTEVEHLAGSVCGAQWSVSQEQGLWRGDQLDQDTLFSQQWRFWGGRLFICGFIWLYLFVYHQCLSCRLDYACIECIKWICSCLLSKSARISTGGSWAGGRFLWAGNGCV